jgi:putative transposase
MRGFTVRGSSCPSDRKQSRRRDRQEEIEAARSEAVASAIAEDTRSVLDAYVREGARKLLQAALECEVEAFVEEYAVKVDEHGRRLVVRNGYLPARSIMTGAGPLEVEQPRVRDKSRRVEE